MFDKAGFTDHFLNEVGASKNACDTYRSFLNRIDQAIGGLDEALLERGSENVAQWAKDTDKEPFATYRSHARSVLKRYSMYRLEKASDGIDDEVSASVVSLDTASELADKIVADANFLREKEMQTQIRQQLAAIEPGLFAIDNVLCREAAVGFGQQISKRRRPSARYAI